MEDSNRPKPSRWDAARRGHPASSRGHACAGALLALALLATPGVAGAQGIGWSEAVTRLTAERVNAEDCVAVLKKWGDEAVVDRAALTYGKARAEMNAVVAGLVTALAEGNPPVSLPDLEARLDRGIADRDALCETAKGLLPETSSEKGRIASLVGAALGSLIEAVVEIYKLTIEEDRLKRRTIQTQLEAAKWPDYASIPPAS